MSGGKSQETTVGYEYYAGAHFVLCHGPIDSIEQVEVADRKVNFAGNSDVVLTIDSSGSMGTEDPDDLRIEAGKRFVDGMNPQARAAVVDFDSGATLLQGLTTDRAALKAALDQIDSSGGTSLTAGVSTALNHLLAESNNAGRFIILLTDGEGSWDSSLADQAADNDVVIFTVGLGGGVDDALLQSIASDTGGQYYKADTASDIDPIFQAILVTTSTIADSGMQAALAGGGTFTEPGIIQARAQSPGLFGGKSREGGISGLVDFCLGFPSQPASSYLKARIGEFVPAYRGVVSAILRQCYLGNNPYLKPWKFRARRIYTRGEGDPQWYWEKAGWPSDHYTYGDMNPIHIIRECLTDPIWGRGLPESEIGPSFEAAADTLHDEGLGMSMLWTKESPVDEFIAEVIRHIDAIRYEDPETGLQEIKLIRGDYDAETLPVLDPSNSDLLHYDTIQVSELTNQVTVTYWDRNRGDDASLTVQDTAAITMAGSITNASIEYPGFSNARNALQAAERDLSQMSRPFARIKIRTSRQAANLKPGDLFVLQDDDLGIAQMVCRVAKRSEKGLLDGSIELEAAEDVFGTALSTYVVPPDSGWVDPAGAPQNLAAATAFEVPYYLLIKTLGESDTTALDPTAGFYAYAGVRPDEGAHVNYGLYAAAEGVPIYPEDIRGADFTPYAVVDGDLDDPSETRLPVSLISDVESLRPGHVALVGDGPAEETEIIELAVVPEEGDTEIEVVRGVTVLLNNPDAV
ncbi:MAG: VWA domain-containing protein, partial [Guyparkeria sp.]